MTVTGSRFTKCRESGQSELLALLDWRRELAWWAVAAKPCFQSLVPFCSPDIPQMRSRAQSWERRYAWNSLERKRGASCDPVPQEQEAAPEMQGLHRSQRIRKTPALWSDFVPHWLANIYTLLTLNAVQIETNSLIFLSLAYYYQYSTHVLFCHTNYKHV